MKNMVSDSPKSPVPGRQQCYEGLTKHSKVVTLFKAIGGNTGWAGDGKAG